MTQAKNILVTGGEGFAGSHLVDSLIGLGHKVTVLDDLSSGARDNVNPGATLVVGDVRDRLTVSGLVDESDACFHLAAIASVQQCNESWKSSHDVNLASFVGLLEDVAKRKKGVIPVVYASSAAIYGNTDIVPVYEDLPPHPISIYGADKAGCEMQAHAAGIMAGVPTFGLRPFNIYGPRQNPHSPYSGVISIFADRIKRGDGVTIFGDGKQTRDFIYIDDVVTYLVAALGKAAPNAPVCNAATGIETSVLDIVHILSGIFGMTPQITHAPARTGDIYRSVADTTRLHSMLGDLSPVTVDDGLKLLAGSLAQTPA